MRPLSLVVVVVASVSISLGIAASASGAPLARPSAAPPARPLLGAPIERRLYSETIDASSFLWNDWNKFVENYHPNYIADDDPATAWVEGAKGSGAGEWLRIQITPLDQTTRIRLHLRNGYQKSKDLFRANARAKQVTVRLLPSKAEKQIALADQDGWQDAVVDQPIGVVRDVELRIDSVYEGTRYADLCVSDVQVFATSLTADNPAFEKTKHQTLMAWRAARLAAAKLFKAHKVQLPLYPAYAVTATDARVDATDVGDMIEAAAKEPGFAREWRAALAIASAVTDDLDALPRAQIAPVAQDRLIEADGLQVVRIQDLADDYDPRFDAGALRLPMLDYVSTMFADQLRVLDVKDRTKVTAFLAVSERCKADVAWARRGAATGDGPSRIQALVVGRCAKIEAREGAYWGRAIELYVYDAAGQLVLSAGRGHVDGYRWTKEDDRPVLAGGRALLAQGSVIEAKKREASADP